MERMDVAQQLTLLGFYQEVSKYPFEITGFASILRQVRSIVSVHDDGLGC